MFQQRPDEAMAVLGVVSDDVEYNNPRRPPDSFLLHMEEQQLLLIRRWTVLIIIVVVVVDDIMDGFICDDDNKNLLDFINIVMINFGLRDVCVTEALLQRAAERKKICWTVATALPPLSYFLDRIDTSVRLSLILMMSSMVSTNN